MAGDLEKAVSVDEKPVGPTRKRTKVKRNWWGKKRIVVVDDGLDEEYGNGVPEKRPAMLYAPIYNGLAAGLSICEYFFGLDCFLRPI